MPFPAKLLNEGERVVVSTRTHPKALIGPVLGAVVVLALAILASRVGEGDDARIAHLVVWALAAVAILWVLVRTLVVWLTTIYTFTNRRFIKRSGFIAKKGRTIPLNRISGVDFDIGVVDRVFGCGTLIVSDASTDGSVELHDIPRVERVQLLVAEELHRLAGGDGVDRREAERRDDGA